MGVNQTHKPKSCGIARVIFSHAIVGKCDYLFIIVNVATFTTRFCIQYDCVESLGKKINKTEVHSAENTVDRN